MCSPVLGSWPDQETGLPSVLWRAHLQAVGAEADGAVRVEKLELQPVPLGKGVIDVGVGRLVVLALGHVVEKGHRRGHPPAGGGGHGGVIVPRQGHRDGSHRQQDDQEHGADGIHHPALADALKFFLSGFHCFTTGKRFLSCSMSASGKSARAAPPPSPVGDRRGYQTSAHTGLYLGGTGPP